MWIYGWMDKSERKKLDKNEIVIEFLKKKKVKKLICEVLHDVIQKVGFVIFSYGYLGLFNYFNDISYLFSKKK